MSSPDVVVIGSGFGGCITALKLAQDGRKVLVLEQGRRIHPQNDFQPSWSPKYLTQFYRFYLHAESNFFYYCASVLGGGSVLYAGASPRAPSEVFFYEDGITGKNRWPAGITRPVLDPFYAEIETKLNVNLIPWNEVSRVGSAFAQMCLNAGKSCDRVPFCIVGCNGMGQCQAGCPIGAKKTLLHNYIPEAEAFGAVFRAESDVRTIQPLPGPLWEVSYWEKQSPKTVKTPLLVLAAGAVGTPALLLRSKANLPQLSSATGKNFHNNGDIPLAFELPPDWPEKHFPFHLYKGRNNPGVMSYAFWGSKKITLHPGSGPPTLFSGLDFHMPDGTPPMGLKYKSWAKGVYSGGRLMPCLVMGMAPPAGKVTVNGAGDPEVQFDPVVMKPYVERAEEAIREIAQANDAKILYTGPKQAFDLGGAHGMGTCRMGTDPADAVCDPNGQVFFYPKLFVADGSLIPGGVGVNPAQTIAANASRVAEYIRSNT